MVLCLLKGFLNSSFIAKHYLTFHQIVNSVGKPGYCMNDRHERP